MALSFYMDEDSQERAVVQALRDAGLLVETANEAHNDEATDEEQLRYAVSTGRVLYSANVPDYARLHSRLMRTGQTHRGIVVRVFQQMETRQQIRLLLAIAAEHGDVGLENRMLYI